MYIFVSEHHRQAGGGSFITNRNYRLFESLAEKFGCSVHRFDILYGGGTGIMGKIFFHLFKVNYSDFSRILDLIKGSDLNAHIWLDRSIYGLFIILLKVLLLTGRLKSHTYFHNNEVKYVKDKYSDSKLLIRFFNTFIAYISQKASLMFSNKLYFISLRERSELAGGKGMFLPPTWEECVIKHNMTAGSKPLPDDPYLLMVGSSFYANINGFRWFVANCMPILNCKLVIVGSGMSNFFESTHNITVYDYVEDLTDMYSNAEMVVVPIFEGAGIKIKALEALTYKKNIVISSFAYCGLEYLAEDVKGYMRVARDRNDFIDIISKELSVDIESEQRCFQTRLLSEEHYKSEYERYFYS